VNEIAACYLLTLSTPGVRVANLRRLNLPLARVDLASGHCAGPPVPAMKLLYMYIWSKQTVHRQWQTHSKAGNRKLHHSSCWI